MRGTETGKRMEKKQVNGKRKGTKKTPFNACEFSNTANFAHLLILLPFQGKKPKEKTLLQDKLLKIRQKRRFGEAKV